MEKEIDARGYNISPYELGNEIKFDRYLPQTEKQKHLQILIHEVNKTLKSGVVYEIRERSYSIAHSNNHGVAWYYLPTLKQEPLFLNQLGEGMETHDGGYVLTGRLKAGEPLPPELF